MNCAGVISAGLDLLLPRVCISCDRLLGRNAPGLTCGLCWTRLAVLPRPICDRCGHPLGEDSCSWCSNLPPHVRSARSYCWYPTEVATRIVGALKYGGWPAIAEEMAQRMARAAYPDDVMAERPIFIPVPLAPSRERERGYNQSALLAEALGRRWGLQVVVDSLRRGRSTVSQTRLTPEQRAANVHGAFEVLASTASSLHGLHVMLVDDVVTTAATLNECAAALMTGGARTVSYVTFGRARAPGDVA
jgi:ComF family protein